MSLEALFLFPLSLSLPLSLPFVPSGQVKQGGTALSIMRVQGRNSSSKGTSFPHGGKWTDRAARGGIGHDYTPSVPPPPKPKGDIQKERRKRVRGMPPIVLKLQRSINRKLKSNAQDFYLHYIQRTKGLIRKNAQFLIDRNNK